jgi:hypothetical protein
MPDPFLYLQAIGAATIVSSLCVWAMVAWRPSSSKTWLNSAYVAGMGLGLAVGGYLLGLRLVWPPVNGLDRLLMIVMPMSLGVELIAGFECVPQRVAWLLRMSLAAAIPRILLHGSVYLSGDNDHLPIWQSVVVMAGCALLLANVWALLSALPERSAGDSLSLILSLTILCAGLTVMMAGYIQGGGAAIPLAATIVATTIAAWLIQKSTHNLTHAHSPAIIGVGVVGLFGVLFIGRFFGRISDGCALAILLAPLLCWATELPFLRHRPPWLLVSIRLIIVATALAVVLFAAKRNFDRDMAPLL